MKLLIDCSAYRGGRDLLINSEKGWAMPGSNRRIDGKCFVLGVARFGYDDELGIATTKKRKDCISRFSDELNWIPGGYETFLNFPR